MDNFDLRKYLAEGRLFEEMEGNTLPLYHRTKISSAKKILTSPTKKLNPGDGRAGFGTYFVYGNPKEISSSMDTYGGASLKYNIPSSSLSKFLIFDKNLQSKPLEQQLNPLKSVIGEERFNEVIDSYNSKTLNELEFIEELIRQNINPSEYFDGILYHSKSHPSNISSLGFGTAKTAGTKTTAIVYNQDLLTFKGISTDGIVYKIPSKSSNKITSRELSLVNGEVPDGSIIKKATVNLQNKKVTTLPDNLEIIGSLDLRNPSIQTFPNNLKVKNTLYILPSQVDLFLSTKPKSKRLLIRPHVPQDVIKKMEKSGFVYLRNIIDRPENNKYYGSFRSK